MAIFTEREIAYLRQQRLGRLATVAKDGTVQNNPAGFGYEREPADDSTSTGTTRRPARRPGSWMSPRS
jgi:hypothetical protein